MNPHDISKENALKNEIISSEIHFCGNTIPTFKKDGVEYVAMRPIVEAFGLAWPRQQQKLTDNSDKFNCTHMCTVARDGKVREMLCIPIKKLNGWLFTVNTEKVNPAIKDKVFKYQEECFVVLYEHWNKGTAFYLTTGQSNKEAIASMKENMKILKMEDDIKILSKRLASKVLEKEVMLEAYNPVPNIKMLVSAAMEKDPRFKQLNLFE